MNRIALILFVGIILVVMVSLFISASSMVDRINSNNSDKMEIINKLN